MKEMIDITPDIGVFVITTNVAREAGYVKIKGKIFMLFRLVKKHECSKVESFSLTLYDSKTNTTSPLHHDVVEGFDGDLIIVRWCVNGPIAGYDKLIINVNECIHVMNLFFPPITVITAYEMDEYNTLSRGYVSIYTGDMYKSHSSSGTPLLD